MISGRNGHYEVACDVCPDGAIEVDAQGVAAAVEKIKRRGWRVRKERDGYAHVCPECAA